MTVTTGATSAIAANHNGITVFANANLGVPGAALGVITSNLNVTTGGNSTIAANNNGIQASLTTLLSNPSAPFNFGNINIHHRCQQLNHRRQRNHAWQRHSSPPSARRSTPLGPRPVACCSTPAT